MEEFNESVEWDWGSELDEMDRDTEQYWREFDRTEDRIDWERLQAMSKQNFADMLKTDIGKDMNEVMSGKKKVKLPFKLKIKYWFVKFFEIFG